MAEPEAFVDPNPIFDEREQGIIRTLERSKLWRLMRDALAYEREILSRRPIDPEARNVLYVVGKKEGALEQVNRLLREGPRLAVYYDRHLRTQEAKGLGTQTERRPGEGEPPDLE